MNDKQQKYEIDMCNGPILSKILIFTLPLMFSSILQLLFNAADIVVVGKFVGDNALAAVGSNTSLINLITNLFIGLSIGANVTAARYYGAKMPEELSKTVHTSMMVSLISGILLTIIGIFGAKQMLIWMQTPVEVLPLATVYLRIYFIGMISTMVYNFGSALLRSIGDTKRPLYYLIIAGVINVVLNIIFIVIFNLGVAGVALATIISQTISAFLVVRCLIGESGSIKLVLSKLSIDKKRLIQILQIGLPAGFQGIVFALSNVVIQSSVNTFGNIVVAGNSAASNIEGFVYVAMNSFYQATISFVSQNYGAGQYKRITKVLIIAQCCVIITGTFLGNIVHLLGKELLSIYSESSEVISAGLTRLGIIARTYALCGVMDVMVGGLRGIGYSVMPMLVSLIGACGLRLLWIATVFQIPEHHNISTVYISYPITWIITLTIHILCFIFAMRKINSINNKKAAI